MEVYLDNSATTRTFPEVAELMTKIMCEDYGNPSSLHMKGVEAEKYLRYAKETLARILKVEERELLFTSGGTESDNMALIGCALANCRRGNHLITTQIEHPAILQTMRYLESQGYRVTYLPVDPCGRIRLEDLRKAMTPETILVSIMHTNNEIGALQPIEEAGALIKQMNPDTLFHVDAVQGFGKSRIYPKKMHIDLLSVSGHKIHGVGYECYDIVVANILADVLVPLTPVIVHQLKKGGIYITSGIIDDKEQTVVEAVKAAGLEVLEVTYQGEWVSVTARKN
jgi:cysteine desulfurase